MTEKLKLTQAQAEALELYKANSGKGLGWMAYFALCKDEFNGSYKVLKDLTVDEMARLLYEPNSYEVDEEYKIKDWVVYDGQIVQIKTIFENDTAHTPYLINFSIDDDNNWHDYEKIERSASPEEIKAVKERSKWAAIGREVGEFRKGDVYKYRDGSIFEIDRNRTNIAKAVYSTNQMKGFYPAGSFVSFKDGDEE